MSTIKSLPLTTTTPEQSSSDATSSEESDSARSFREPSILEYIASTWKTLTRSHRDYATAAADSKAEPTPDQRWPIYISADEDLIGVEQQLDAAMTPAKMREIEVRRLPRNWAEIQDHGLLYLPHPYVVPGGRFNEMYGWDSYFIQLGLLRDGELDLAKNLVDNFLYQIRHYGAILNANRTYYLSRSQPPFLTQMLLGVYAKTGDKDWLRSALPCLESYYQFWAAGPHSTPITGLSRYYDLGEGPAPEVVVAERDCMGRTHYERIHEYFRSHDVGAYDIGQYYDDEKDELTPLFYIGDRAMRESGFDPSNRFGPFNIDIIHYNPVCLNSLLYVMEKETAEILNILDQPAEAVVWLERAEARAAKINQLMWDEQDGFYYDFQFQKQSRRPYPYLSTFFPLWAGIASAEQAARIAGNLHIFECNGGLQTSFFHSGNQWDAPFGWAPLQMIAVQGLRRYGYQAPANRIAKKFLRVVHDEYQVSGTILEKYDVVNCTGDLGDQVKYGYHSNETGFGWTNAVFTTLLDELSSEDQSECLRQTPSVRMPQGEFLAETR